MDSIESDRLKQVVVNLMKDNNIGDAEWRNADRLDETTCFTKDLGFDSLDTLELVSAIEDAFGVEVPDKLIGEVHTIGDLRVALKAQSGAGSA